MRKASSLWIIALFGIFILYSCASDDNSTTDDTAYLEAETRLNVSYGIHEQHTYDLYLPEGRSSDFTKVIMLIHGGGWTSGDKSDMTGIVSVIQNLHPDHAVVNVNYVLATTEIPAFPNQFLDIKTIITKLTNEREELQIKPEFGLIGASAGAHIAMMYDYFYDNDNRVKFVANIVGPTDFDDPFYTENPNFEFLLALLVDENSYPPGTDYSQAVSPLYQVSASSSPTCLFYGTEDPLVPTSNGTNLHQKLIDYSVDTTLRIYEGGHGDNWSQADITDMYSVVSDYLKTYLHID